MDGVTLATNRLIDSVWTVAYTVGDDGRATIHGYGRDCGTGYRDERVLERCNLVERKEGRVVTALVIQPYRHHQPSARADGEGARTYEVANPQNVFSYGEAPEAG